MFNAELDMCKHLYDDHVIQVSGWETSAWYGYPLESFLLCEKIGFIR